MVNHKQKVDFYLIRRSFTGLTDSGQIMIVTAGLNFTMAKIRKFYQIRGRSVSVAQ